MATLLENDLKSLSAVSSTDPIRELPLNNSVVGNLTTRTDTSDTYRVPIEKSETLVKVSFSAEQQVNEFDYYILDFGLGPLHLKPDSNMNRLKDGILISLSGGTKKFTDFRVSGSLNGLFKENYKLEITEVAPVQGVTYANPRPDDLTSAAKAPLSGTITGWQSEYGINYSGEDNTYFGNTRGDHFKFVVPKGESGKLQFMFSEKTNLLEASTPSGSPLSPESTLATFNLLNEGTRLLLWQTVKIGESMTSPLLTEGIYFLHVYDMIADGTVAINYFIDTTFQSTVTQSTPTTAKGSLTILVDKGVLGPSPFILKDLVEEITSNGSTVTSHLIIYNGVKFNYADVDALITTVVRNGNFTDEFRNEILDLAPNLKDVKYEDLVKLVGVGNIDNVILNVAGADGNFVG